MVQLAEKEPYKAVGRVLNESGLRRTQKKLKSKVFLVAVKARDKLLGVLHEILIINFDLSHFSCVSGARELSSPIGAILRQYGVDGAKEV